MRNLFGSAAVLTLVIATASFVTPAAAQSTGDASNSSGSTASKAGESVSEVVVTARKESESVGDIPATVVAVTADQLAATGPVVGTGDLIRTVPGVRFNDLQAPNLSEISIRGSGTQRATGADSGVGLFVNGAYAGSSTLGGRNFKNLDFFDLDRVEVLEGPQGGLYGRNAEFGVVNLVSAKPAFNNSGSLDESYTNGLDQNRVTAVVNTQLSDDVATRLSFQTISQDKGFYLNPDDNTYYDKTSGWLARDQIRFKHGPLDVTLLVDGQDLKLPTFVSGFAVAPGTTTTIPFGFTNNRFDVPSNGINSTEQQVKRVQLFGDLDLGFGTLTSTSMYSSSKSLQYYGSSIDEGIETQLRQAGEIGVYPLSQVHTDGEDQTWYEDLHLAGKSFGDLLNWLVGIEGLSQGDSNLLNVATSPCALTVASGICGGTPSAPICFKPLVNSTTCPAVFPLPFGTSTYTPQRYTSQAVYAALRYKIKNLTLDGEIRYTNDLKKATQFASLLYTGVQTAAPIPERFHADRTNYTFTASYQLPGALDDLVYFKTGTGYRAGGVNNGTSTPVAPVPFRNTYGDEDTDSYEVGFKGKVTSNIFVTLDGYMSHTDNAISVITDGCAVTNICGKGATIFNINGGNTDASGIELAIDGHFQVAGGRLVLDLNGAHQHAKFVSLNASFAGLPILGSPVAQIPQWTAVASADYFHPITSKVDGFIHVAYNGQWGGSQDTVTATAPYVPITQLTDISLRTGIDYRKIEAAIFVENLTDQTRTVLNLQTLGVTTALRYNQPRTVGVNLTYRW